MNTKTDISEKPDGDAVGALRAVGLLPGMLDFLPDTSEGARDVYGKAVSFLVESGFQRIDTPVLEDSELFVRKGGGELTGLLYTFTDPGGNRVSLRPEFTSSVIRLFVANPGLDLPLRWCYGGPVFRYDRHGGRCRQFTQVGAETIGADGLDVDADLVATALSGLRLMGVTGAAAKIGHIEAFSRIFSAFDLSDSSRRFVAGNLGRLKRGQTDAERLSARAREAGLVGANGDGAQLNGPDTQRLLAELEGMPGTREQGLVGRRTPGEILSRLQAKTTQPRDPAELDRALDVAARLVRLEGGPGETLKAAQSLADEAGADSDALDPVAELVQALNDSGVNERQLIVDMGLARGMAYYTGAIFDLVDTETPGTNAETLGGGGRYDGLVQTLGGPNVATLGFAYDMEAVAGAAGVT
jgi:ATP phosphoribosyltransferase regulatory subunit